jgi:uncharacterized membrane protein
VLPDTVRHHALPTLIGLACGLLGAVLVLGVDAVVGNSSAVSAENARVLLGATFGAVVTIGAFTFWMRPLAVQLAASTVPPRTVASHLHDRFQSRVVAVAVGTLAFEATVLLSLPAGSTEGAPVVAVVAGTVLGVAAIAALLVAIEHAERSTQPSVLVSESAQMVVRHIRAAANEPASIDVDAALDDDAAAVVTPATSGWIRSVDDEGLLAAAPDGATVRLESDVGAFVVAGWTAIVRIWPPDAVTEDVRRDIGAQVRIGERRDGTADVIGSLSQFTDIAVQAAIGGSSAPSVVYESMWYLGAILHELVRHDHVGRADRRLDDGRVLLAPGNVDGARLAHLAVDRIRRVTASSPEMALELVRVVGDVRRAAADRGRDEIVEVLDGQADRIVEQCRHAGALPADVERVADARGGSTDDETDSPEDEAEGAARDEEYGGR